METTQQVVTEKDVEKNTVVSDKPKQIEVVLKDLEESYKNGLISKDVYIKAKNKLINPPKPPQEEKERTETQQYTSTQKEKEHNINIAQTKVVESQQNTSSKEEAEKSIKMKDERPQDLKDISIIKRKQIANLKRMKESWIKDLNSLRELYEHGVISEEEYERSKAGIEEKIDKIEEIIKKELEVEELEELKERIEKEIKEAFNSGVFKEEENKLKHDLEALNSLFSRGLLSQAEYEKKKEQIEKQLENYSKLNDMIDAIFNKFIEEIKSKIEKNEAITKEQQSSLITQTQPQVEEQKSIKKPWYVSLLRFLGLYEEKKERNQNDELIEKINKAYKESENRFKISNMALVIKKKVKEILGIDKALTYKEIINEIEKNNKINNDLKSKLKSYFQSVMLKEYLEEEDEKDIENMYKQSIEIAKLLENFSPLKKEKPTQKNNEEEIKETKEEKKEKQREQQHPTTKEENINKNTTKEKRSIFDKINEFFGV